MPEVAISPVVRALLTGNINMSADEVIHKAKAKGVTASDNSIRMAVHNIKSALKKSMKKAEKAAPVPAATRATSEPAVAPEPITDPAASLTSTTPDLTAVLANVARVNTLIGTCGGFEQARQAAEVVRSCGGVDAFLQHLDLVAKVRGV